MASKRPTDRREQASVQRYLDEFAAALTLGDAKTMCQLWGVPAFVLGRAEARVVQSELEVEQLVESARANHEQRGITQIRAEIQHLDWVQADLVVATVRWIQLDEREDELGENTSSYTLLRGEDGSYRVRSVLMRGGLGAGEAETSGTDEE